VGPGPAGIVPELPPVDDVSHQEEFFAPDRGKKACKLFGLAPSRPQVNKRTAVQAVSFHPGGDGHGKKVSGYKGFGCGFFYEIGEGLCSVQADPVDHPDDGTVTGGNVGEPVHRPANAVGVFACHLVHVGIK